MTATVQTKMIILGLARGIRITLASPTALVAVQNVLGLWNQKAIS
jgi:hypothetical protein